MLSGPAVALAVNSMPGLKQAPRERGSTIILLLRFGQYTIARYYLRHSPIRLSGCLFLGPFGPTIGHPRETANVTLDIGLLSSPMANHLPCPIRRESHNTRSPYATKRPIQELSHSRRRQRPRLERPWSKRRWPAFS